MNLRSSLVLVALLLPLLAGRPPVAAQQPDGVTVRDVQQRDTDGDGQPDVTIIDCSFATERDRVLVYDLGNDMQAASDWRSATDFTNDAWVFDAGADGTAELIIRFSTNDQQQIAELFDDRTSDGMVEYTASPSFAIRESLFATVQVRAVDGWWEQAEWVNYNLDISTDGPVRTMFSWSDYIQILSNHNGTPDFTIQVRDPDRDGRPDYQWVDIAEGLALSSSDNVVRTSLMVNPADDEPPVRGAIFWPYLGSDSSYTKDYGISPPPISIDWERAVINHVGEFVGSRFNDAAWFVYSLERITPAELTSANFEAPFGFYDLARDDDGFPELQVRVEVTEPYFFEGFPHWTQVVRYSWDQHNTQNWDYKLDLVGSHEVASTVALPFADATMVPYADLPAWVTGREWGLINFAATEQPYWTSEGIYEDLVPVLATRSQYVTGQINRLPASDYSTIPAGM
ncbi:MAG: hypothetical protein HC893_16435, partial [Chloroflexaceae bacterium]|nr:hypothetical protein [Chloroflexaceae bacterium]